MHALLASTLLCCTPALVAQDTIRSRAVVDLPLDANTSVADAAKAGKHTDEAAVSKAPQLINSPFWNQKGKALILDAAAQQAVTVKDSPDLDRGKAATVSLFYLNLHPLTDAGFHGIFGKRGPANDSRTNYGLNFQPSSDAFQLYIHDGAGFKVAQYSVRQTVGFSKLVHLTATFEVADAPGADADKDVDDMRIRLFINGKIVKPKASSAGFVDGNDAWLTNLDVPKLLNDVPLTVGSSFGGMEFASGVYDEFLLFDTALSPSDVGKLFVELTGATAEQIASAEQQQRAKQVARPQVSSVLPRGLQTGATTRVTIRGSRLKDCDLFFGSRVAGVKVVKTEANSLIADVTVPESVVPGFYPFRVHSNGGVSNPTVVAIDRLPEHLATASTAEKPAALPAAFSGTLGGTQQGRIWFSGKKGQRIVADVESRRLGSTMDPVVEIKTNRGTPLTIEWRNHLLFGDTRASVTLPADGVYFVEVHDLSYKAPGNSPFRVRVGDLKVIDRFLPSGNGSNNVLAAVGPGLDDKVQVKAKRGTLPEQITLENLPAVDGPLPPLPTDAIVEVREAGGDKIQEVDATFADAAAQSIVAVNGTIAKAGETDQFALKVTEGTRLHFSLSSRSIGSRLDGTLRVFNGNQLLGAKDSAGTGADIAFDVAVPKGVKTLTARVRDFTRGGSADHGYRLRVSKSGRAGFRVTAKSGTIEIPENGSAVMRLSVLRQGGGFSYNGPIRLSLAGRPGLTITPQELPAENTSRDVFVVLTRTEPADARIVPISIVAESVQGPGVRQIVRVPTTTPVVVSQSTRTVAAGRAPAVSATINVAGIPPVLFRGLEATLPLQISALSDKQVGTVRFKLMSTEKPRDKKPSIAAPANQFVAGGQTSTDFRIRVPLDQVEPVIDCVVVGELVENPFAPVASGTVYSAPVRMQVRNAVQVAPAAASLKLTIGTKAAVSGRLTRQFGFVGPVKLSIAGLPKGYAAAPVTVAPDASEFSIPVTLPAQAKPADLKAQLVIQSGAGAAILPNRPITIKVVQPAK